MPKAKMNGFGNQVSALLPVLVGYAAGQVLTKQLTFLSANPTMGNFVKLGAGLFFASQKGFLGGAAQGLALNGATGIAMPMLEASGIGLLPPGVPARYIAGIPTPDEVQTAAPIQF